jgi:hypothetical protein
METSTPCTNETAETQVSNETANRYTPPMGNVYNDWDGQSEPDFVPTARQIAVIGAVQAALDAGRYYTKDVLDFCITHLGVTAEQAEKASRKVEGGDVGLDCYYARDYLKKQEEHRLDDKALAMINPFVGKSLGTLVFGDFKRNTNMQITVISENRKLITVKGKRGRCVVTVTCNATQIRNGVDRAHGKGLRKDSFQDLFGIWDTGKAKAAIAAVVAS